MDSSLKAEDISDDEHMTISRRDSSSSRARAPWHPASRRRRTVARGDPLRRREQADRARRMKWWHEAKFGMFIHWGLYSLLGRHEWVMEMEGIPVSEYEPLAKQFKPKPGSRASGRSSRNAPGRSTW